MLARLFRELAPFEPTLVGTYPLGLRIDTSDLDVICCAPDLATFERALETLPVTPDHVERVPLAPEAVVATLRWDDVVVELFCQTIPVYAQAGFRHMVVEGRLLALGGARLRDRVRAEKRAGARTEPAFARVLGLAGDPYAAILELEPWPFAALQALVDRALEHGPT